VGRMGANIARRLSDLGYEIAAVYDLHHPVAVSVAGELGANATESLPEVSALSDVIFTVVTDDAAMDSIFTGANSLLVNVAGKTFINCATVSPESHEKAADAAAKAGAQLHAGGHRHHRARLCKDLLARLQRHAKQRKIGALIDARNK